MFCHPGTYKFLSNKKVLRIDGTISASNGWDWLESRVAYPDWAVAGGEMWPSTVPSHP